MREEGNEKRISTGRKRRGEENNELMCEGRLIHNEVLMRGENKCRNNIGMMRRMNDRRETWICIRNERKWNGQEEKVSQDMVQDVA